MKENQEELDKEMTDAQPEPEIDVEAAEDSGISEAEAEEFETAKLKAELEEMEDKYLRARAEIAIWQIEEKMSVSNYKNTVHKI